VCALAYAGKASSSPESEAATPWASGRPLAHRCARRARPLVRIASKLMGRQTCCASRSPAGPLRRRCCAVMIRADLTNLSSGDEAAVESEPRCSSRYLGPMVPSPRAARDAIRGPARLMESDIAVGGSRIDPKRVTLRSRAANSVRSSAGVTDNWRGVRLGPPALISSTVEPPRRPGQPRHRRVRGHAPRRPTVRDHAGGVDIEVIDRAVDVLEVPYAERALRLFRNAMAVEVPGDRAAVILDLVAELSLEPPSQPQPLPTSTPSDVYLVCWLALVPTSQGPQE
jgi:hypothetical protein